MRAEDVRPYPFVFASMSRDKVGLIEDIDSGFTVDSATGDILSSIAVSSFGLGLEIVAGTDAISLGHISQIQEGIAAGKLALLDLPWRKERPVAELGIAYKRERTLPPSARAFIGLIRKRMRAVASRPK